MNTSEINSDNTRKLLQQVAYDEEYDVVKDAEFIRKINLSLGEKSKKTFGTVIVGGACNTLNPKQI